jgi:hypothetical protein
MGSEYGPAAPVLRLRVIDGVDPRDAVILETATGLSERMTLDEAARRSTEPVLVILPARLFRSYRGATGTVTDMLGRMAMALALRVSPASLAVIETRDAAGRRLLVAAAQATLAETTRFLEAYGLSVAGLVPDAAPAPVGPAAGVTGSAIATLSPILSGRKMARPAGIGAVAALLIGAALALAPGRSPETPSADPVLPPVPAIAAADLPAADAGLPLAMPEPPGLLVEPPDVLQPVPRALPRIAILASDPPAPRPAALPQLSAAAGEAVTHPPRAVATRSIPPELREEMRAATAEGRAAANDGRARQVAALMPLARPGGGGSAIDAAGPEDALSLRPRPRPRHATGTEAGAVAADPTAAARPGPGARPMPRPREAGRAIAEAIGAALSGDLGAEAAAGSSAALLAARRPEPRRVAAPPQVARAAPATRAEPQRPAASAPPAQAAERASPPGPAAQPTQIARAAPARPAGEARPPAQPVQQQARPAAAVQPQQQARPTAAVQPQQQARPVTAQPQQQARFQPAPPAPAPQASAGANPGAGLTLIGVFGTSSQRHALIRLPGGSVQRVRAGESVGGVQIAAVGQDSVRFRAGGREGVLRLPD